MTGRTIRWTLLAALAALLGVGAAMAATGAVRGGATVRTAKVGKLGTVLVAANGRTLYRFTHDRRHVDTCSSNAACNKYWPPLVVRSTARPTAGPGVDAKLLGTIPHGAGKLQVTYGGYPLYFFASDKESGDAYGEGVQKVWFAVSPSGALVKKAAGTTGTTTTTPAPTTTAPAGGGGGGYGSGYGG